MPNGGKEKNKPKLLLSMSYHSPRWGTLKPGHRHCHDFCEIMFVKDGSGKVIFDDGEEKFKKGDVVVYNPGTMHSECFDEQPVATIVFIGISNLAIDGLEPGCLCKGKHAVLSSETHYDALFFYLDQLFSEKDQTFYVYPKTLRVRWKVAKRTPRLKNIWTITTPPSIRWMNFAKICI